MDLHAQHPTLTPKDRYAEYLRSPHWASLRAQVHKRNSLRCEACNAPAHPHGHEVHHLHYGKAGNWLDITPDDLIGLCSLCHAKAHTHPFAEAMEGLPLQGDLRRRKLLAWLTPLPLRLPSPPQPSPAAQDRAFHAAARTLGLKGRNKARARPKTIIRLAAELKASRRAAIAHNWAR